MKLNIFHPALFLFVLVTLTVTGCSDFDEMKSQRALIQAEKVIEEGDEAKAELALSNLIEKYPRTQAGEIASKHLFRIKKQREFRERREFAKILDSYQQVLNGYHALYAEYPGSLSDLDQSEYFFDTSYLDEITPEGYQVYLWLMDDGRGYRAWCVANDKELGYAITNAGRKLISFKPEMMLKKLQSDFQSSVVSNKLISLQPRS